MHNTYHASALKSGQFTIKTKALCLHVKKGERGEWGGVGVAHNYNLQGQIAELGVTLRLGGKTSNSISVLMVATHT